MLEDPQVRDVVLKLIEEGEWSPGPNPIDDETAGALRAVREKGQALREMSLHTNPFYLIGATTRDDRRRIVALAEEKSLHADHESCQKARSTLTNPRTRLTAEVGWLPGVSPKKAEHLMRLLTQDPMAIRAEKGIPTLAHANLLAAVFDTLGDEEPPESVADFIVEFAWVADNIEPSTVLRDINEDRSVSGFAEIADGETIETEISEKRKSYRDTIKSALGHLSTTNLMAVMSRAVVLATNSGENYGPELIHELADAYEVGAQGFLVKEAANISQLVASIKDAASRGTAAVDPLIARVGAVAANWTRVAQPILLSTKARGIQHQSSAGIAYSIRGLAGDLFNERGMLVQAQTLTNIIGESFSDAPEVSELVTGDMAVIADLFERRNEAVEKEEEWAKEITYEAEIGAVFKQQFRISPDGIEWKGRRFPLETIKQVRWGGMRHSVNGIPTGTTYTIIFGDSSTYETVSLRRSEVYSKIIGCLWGAVCGRLITELLMSLANAKWVRFGGALIGDEGVELTRHRTFRSGERVRCSWAEVQVYSADGSFFIKSKSDSKTYDSMSYVQVDNVHVLEAVIRVFFKAPHPRMSDLLKGG